VRVERIMTDKGPAYAGMPKYDWSRPES
jgi:hypothetical protein